MASATPLYPLTEIHRLLSFANRLTWALSRASIIAHAASMIS
jgi:hypothetical protein